MNILIFISPSHSLVNFNAHEAPNHLPGYQLLSTAIYDKR